MIRLLLLGGLWLVVGMVTAWGIGWLIGRASERDDDGHE